MSDPSRLDGRVAVVTGATGVLGGSIARAVAAAGARVGVLARDPARCAALAAQLDGGFPLPADVRDRAQLEAARDAIGRVDLLVTAAGGNVAGATLPPGGAFADLEPAAVREVVDLNLLGTWLPCQVLAPTEAIVTVSSMAAARALTRVGPYGAAKAGVESLTRWLATELAPVRANAIAPGFFLGEQNRALLLDEAGEPTERGRAILARTPAGRFGDPDDLVGAVVWLCSPAARFVTGAVIPVDGGFGAWHGV